MHQFDGCVSLSTHADVDLFFLAVGYVLFVHNASPSTNQVNMGLSRLDKQITIQECEKYVCICIYIYTWIYQSFYLVINRPGIYHQHFIVGRQPNIPGGEGMGRSWFGLRGGWSQLHCQSRRWSWWSWGTSCVFGKNNNGILGIVWWIGEYIYIYIYT